MMARSDADRLTDIARSGASAGLNGTFHYDYDDAGNISGRTYPDSTTASTVFDDDGRLTSVGSGGVTTSFGYDEAGNIATVTLPSGNGHVATRSFDRAGRLTTVENKKGTTILSKFLWTLDPGGNPTKVQTTRGTTDVYDAYEYDARNRLTASCFDIGVSPSDCTGAANKITYTYDKVSNRTQEIRAGNVGNTGTIDYTYNSADQLTQTSKGGTNTTFTYDANGNQATAGGRTFTHNLADQLASTTNAGTTTTYGYDGDGRRVSSSVGGGGADIRSVWDPLAESGIAELALERTPAGSLVRRYLSGPLGTVSLTNASATFYYHQDPLRTVTDVTDASGVAQWKYEYEAYGAQRSATNVSGTAPENRLRFNGQYLDPETGLYHLRARQYDPTLGRFGALDPIEPLATSPYNGSYVYVNGMPTAAIDPLGLCLWGACGWVADTASTVGNATVGAAVGTGRAVVGGARAVGHAAVATGRFVAEHPDEIVAVGTIAACSTGVGCIPALAVSGALTTARVAQAAKEGDWTTATTEIGFAAIRPAKLLKCLKAANNAPAAERLFSNRFVGVDSKLFGHSYARGDSGLLNRTGSRFKVGWSNSGEFGGGWHLRLGVGRNPANANQARFHRDFGSTHVPDSVANDLLDVIRDLNGLL